MKADCLDKYPKITAYVKNFEVSKLLCTQNYKYLLIINISFKKELPGIKEYLASPEFLKYPLNNKIAKFGGN